MPLLDRHWFGRDAPDDAADLLNKVLVSTILVSTVDGGAVAGRIIEVEAYTDNDPASHSF